MSDRDLTKVVVAVALIAVSALVIYQSSRTPWQGDWVVEVAGWGKILQLPEYTLWGRTWGSVLLGAGMVLLFEVSVSRLGIWLRAQENGIP